MEENQHKTIEENQYQIDKLGKILTAGLISGVVAAVLNIIYMVAYEAVIDYSERELVNFLSVALSTIIPSVFVGLLYFALRRVMNWSAAFITFIIVVVALTLLSFGGPLSNELPNGADSTSEFVWLTLPMHIIASLTYIIMITRSVKR